MYFAVFTSKLHFTSLNACVKFLASFAFFLVYTCIKFSHFFVFVFALARSAISIFIPFNDYFLC